MNPGKQLDRLIQLNVFKSNALFDVRKELTPIVSLVTLEEAKTYPQDEGYTIISSTFVPNYSTDLEEAFKVVNKLSSEGVFFVLTKDFSSYEASFGSMEDHYAVESVEAAHAICLAALELCGIKMSM